MPISLNNSKDIVANSVSVIKGNRTIDLVETIDAVQGLAPETLNSLEKLASAMNNDPNFFTAISTAIGDKADKSTTYTRLVTNDLLDKKVDDTEMVDYAHKTYVTSAVNTRQATLGNGTAITNSQAILATDKIKNIVPGTGISMVSNDNNITITGVDAYNKDEITTKIQTINTEINKKQATLSNGTLITGSKSLLDTTSAKIKNIVGKNLELTEDANNLTITAIDAYDKPNIDTKYDNKQNKFIVAATLPTRTSRLFDVSSNKFSIYIWFVICINNF